MKKMTVLNMLSAAQNDRSEKSNIDLAIKIVETKGKLAVKELIENLSNKKLQNSCIKTLYEIGERNPALISPYLTTFIELLKDKNNRIQWGAMHTLYTITPSNTKTIYNNLGKILAAADSGSVITRDNAVRIIIHFLQVKEYANKAFSLLNEQLLSAPQNQLPMYAELAEPFITTANKKIFVNTLTLRLKEMDSETKKKRLQKIIAKALN